MRVRTSIITILLSLLTITSLATAQRAAKLAVGDKAPGLNVDEWIKGSFNPAEADVYVVEFWATWCGPCRKSIPHLTALQEEYELDGLQIIGISTDEDTSLVAPFVKRQGLKMNYIVATDNRNRTQRAWMKAAGLQGIPAAFIVDKEGIIQFIGNPLVEEFEEVLAKVMSGRFDRAKSREAKPAIDAAKHFRSLNSWSESIKAYTNAIAIDPVIFAHLYIEEFEMLLLEKKDTAAAYALAELVITQRGSEDPELLTWLAETIATNDRIVGNARRMSVAMKAAQTALTFAKRKSDPAYIATIAMVHFHNGNIDEAIEWQRKAYFSAREKNKAKYKFTLDSYRMQKQHASAD